MHPALSKGKQDEMRMAMMRAFKDHYYMPAMLKQFVSMQFLILAKNPIISSSKDEAAEAWT